MKQHTDDGLNFGHLSFSRIKAKGEDALSKGAALGAAVLSFGINILDTYELRVELKSNLRSLNSALFQQFHHNKSPLGIKYINAKFRCTACGLRLLSGSL